MGQNPGLAEPSSLPRSSACPAEGPRGRGKSHSLNRRVGRFRLGLPRCGQGPSRPRGQRCGRMSCRPQSGQVGHGAGGSQGCRGQPQSGAGGWGQRDRALFPHPPPPSPWRGAPSPGRPFSFVPPPSPAAVGRTWGQGASQAPWPREVTLSRWPELGVGGGRVRPAGPPGAARPGGRPRECVDSWPSGQASWSRGEVARGQPALGRAAGGGVSLPACPTRAPGSLLLSPRQQ